MSAFLNTTFLSIAKSVQKQFSLATIRNVASMQSFEDNKFTGYVPIEKLQIKYSHSSGPGGQHVNNVETKVDLRFHVKSAEWLPDKVRNQILEKKKEQITRDGFLVFRSELTRYRHLNLANVMDKLRTCIRDICKSLEDEKLKELSPEKAEEIKNRILNMNINRLKFKRYRSMTRECRGSV